MASPRPKSTTANQAAVGPAATPVSAAANALPVGLSDTPAQARGRRILSTAFVRVGPDGQLTVETRGGRVLVLRDVVMRRKDYCGVQVTGRAGVKYCGDYAEVATARPGGAPSSPEPDHAAANPLGS